MRRHFETILALKTDGGGFLPLALGIWSFLFELQKKNAIRGNMLEIGLWKGVAMCAMVSDLAENEKFFGIDINVQKEEIERNLSAVSTRKLDEFGLLHGDSCSLKKRGALKGFASTFRWIHIDGEHSYDAVRNDLEFAVDLISSGGVIVLDDVPDTASLCITHGLFDFLRDNPHKARMFLVGANKAYLASPRFYGLYRQACISHLNDYLEKNFNILTTVAMNGHSTEVDYLGIVSRSWDYKFQTIGRYMKEIPKAY